MTSRKKISKTVLINKKDSEPDYLLAEQLEGTPKNFPCSALSDLEKLAELNIAANFGASGWARGFAWSNRGKVKW